MLNGIKIALLTGVLLCFVFAGAEEAQAIPAPDGNSVLILADTVGPASPSLEETAAVAAGLTPVVVDAATWGATTAAEFATYRAIVLGDPSCGGIDSVAAAIANRGTWSPAVTGNVVVVGTDPTYHSSFFAGGFGDQVAVSGIAFAASAATTGAYITLSCYYHDTAPATPVPLLDQFGSFTVDGVGCYNDSHIVAVHPALAGLTDASLSDWSCSVHEAFSSFPVDFLPLAIAENIGGVASLTFADGSFGLPYIIGRGEELSPVFCGNGILEETEECDDGNTTNGDGCSAQCTIEVPTAVCGNGVVEEGEECDPPSGDPGCALEYCGADCLFASRIPTCGDGCVDEGETCDDGNTANGDGCPADCNNQPPDCSGATPSLDSLWPPNHTYRSVSVLDVSDPDGDDMTIVVNGVWQDEPVDVAGNGDGNTCPDATIIGGEVSVRAERQGKGNGRVYHLSFTATDPYGESCTGSVMICVPHDQDQGSVCVDNGATFNSLVCP